MVQNEGNLTNQKQRPCSETKEKVILYQKNYSSPGDVQPIPGKKSFRTHSCCFRKHNNNECTQAHILPFTYLTLLSRFGQFGQLGS